MKNVRNVHALMQEKEQLTMPTERLDHQGVPERPPSYEELNDLRSSILLLTICTGVPSRHLTSRPLRWIPWPLGFRLL